MTEASSEVGIYSIYTREKLRPLPKNRYSTEIASISVSAAKLLVLPMLGTVSTSGLYLMFSNLQSYGVDASGSGSGVPVNCRSRREMP